MLHYRLHRDPKSSHQQIATLVRRLGCSPILDVGAAQGFLGQLLRDSSLMIDAVEPNPQWAEHAQPFYRRVFASSIEDAALPARTYRVIVCADVLEHTVDPEAVVRQLRHVAADDALFIISLPNVAHLAVRLMLLFGRFPQMERGILDRTHLHFYTLDTATEMLCRAGLEVVRARPTGVPLDELWPQGEGNPLFGALMRLQHLALLLAPRLFGFQWVLVARRRNGEPRTKS
ncbi:MAG TPA: class I SAM-dependent methyltransferase [Herpetosiphonaceae bacterium]